jgi:hypothetical protein
MEECFAEAFLSRGCRGAVRPILPLALVRRDLVEGGQRSVHPARGVEVAEAVAGVKVVEVS